MSGESAWNKDPTLATLELLITTDPAGHQEGMIEDPLGRIGVEGESQIQETEIGVEQMRWGLFRVVWP